MTLDEGRAPSERLIGVLDPSSLVRLLQRSRCRIFGASQAGNGAHRYALAKLVEAFDRPEAKILCEASLVSSTAGPPDLVLVDDASGVHVIEVKGITIDQVESVEAGGEARVRYESGISTKSFIRQVQKAMYSVRDAAARFGDEPLEINFEYWITFPRIRRSEWKWGFLPKEFLFHEDLDRLTSRFEQAGAPRRSQYGYATWRASDLDRVMKAFGDSAVLQPSASHRQGRRTEEGTLGDYFDESATQYRNLTDEQQDLVMETWDDGPRLIRGVAGSGKSIVLANNLARRLERFARSDDRLFRPSGSRPRIATICFNRTLVPLLKEKVARAFEQRMGRPLDRDVDLMFGHLNRFYFELGQGGAWRYMTNADAKAASRAESGMTANEFRARHFLDHLLHLKSRDPAAFERIAFDTIYVDEGQDLHPAEVRLLSELCRVDPSREPNLIVFYDDAQNLYGQPRPNWKEIGLDLTRGRSTIMTTCHRNPRQVVEAAFNVLYGTCAPEKANRPSKDYGDVVTLEGKHLIRSEAGLWRIDFAKRDARIAPRVTILPSSHEELRYVVSRLRTLVVEQQVRPQDILVIAMSRDDVEAVAKALREASIPGVRVRSTVEEKDNLIGEPGVVTVSTVHSAKGYDAYAVLIVAANRFRDSVLDRALFYVACTRAIDLLEVTAHAREGLAVEFERALERLSSAEA
jgi:superfamily I DNA and RNA helicase